MNTNTQIGYFEQIRSRDAAELQLVMQVKAPKAQLALMASVLEAELAIRLARAGLLNIGAKPNLVELIDQAHYLGILKRVAYTYAEKFREIRNLIHPGTEVGRGNGLSDKDVRTAYRYFSIAIQNMT